MGKIVGLVKTRDSQEGIRDSLSQVLDLIDFKPPISVKSVVIKPNLCYYWDASTGYTTDPRLVGVIIDYARERFGADVEIKVAEADASAMRTRHAFPVLGYDKLAKDKGVQLFNLSKDSLVEETVKVNNREFRFKVPQVLVNSDLFVNMPKLKIMQATKITCAMKNVFGCIGTPRKAVYHPFLHEAIVGINRLLRPHLTIVDGLVGLGRFPRKLGLIMAGVDPFSVDWVASQIMGYSPSGVEFLKLAMKENVGDPKGISTVGASVSDFAKMFPREGFVASRRLWGAMFWLLKAYRRIVGDVVPPVLDEI